MAHSTLINALTPIGTAYPPDMYQNPVATTRQVIIGLQRLETNGVDMYDMDTMVAGLGDNVEAATWIQNNWQLYLDGINGRGFEVKRYRVALEFYSNPDDIHAGSDVKLREGEVAKELTEYAADVLRTFIARGYTVKKREDKSSSIQMEVIDSSTGGTKMKEYCRLRVSVIRPRDFTPIRDQRYPAQDDKARQEAEAKVAYNLAK